ncbi:hypothetical protein I4U23_004506 [Adineta vaga]|nr:hypothetical protein I4U23_004506 [Adineta vaga]
MPGITSFEQLPIELFYEIFDYLDTFDLYRAFSDLNSRINTILINTINLHFQPHSRDDVNHPFVDRFAQRIVSLHLLRSDYLDQIQFLNVRSLNILDYLSDQQLTSIRYENFPHLVYLNMPFIDESETSSHFFQRIFSNEFPCLHKCILGDITLLDSIHPWSISSSLRSLISTGFSLSTYVHILNSCPNLIYLHWSARRFTDDDDLQPARQQHNQLRYLYLRTINIEIIRLVLTYIPHLERLCLISDWSRGNNCLPLDFVELARTLKQYIPDLTRFDCNTMERNPIEINNIHKLHPCFQRIQFEFVPNGRTRFFTIR